MCAAKYLMQTRNKSIEALFKEIASLASEGISSTGRSVMISDAIDIYESILSSRLNPLTGALRVVVSRFIETCILSDPVCDKLIQRWSSVGNDAERILQEHITQITGVRPGQDLIQFILRILRGSAAQRGRRTASYEGFLPALMKSLVDSGQTELRCQNCGYHFKESDLSLQRANIARSEGLQFADRWHIRRANNSDLLKPTNTPRQSLTGLTIDHIVPEEGLGWTTLDNLQILCSFCNSGKLIYRRPLEPISLFVAAGLYDYLGDREMNRVLQSIVVSSFAFNENKCAYCSKPVSSVELTAQRVKDYDAGQTRTCAPWNFRSVCYECVLR
jgi:5-methylcytosine-specific restriction endonuclease McrA